MHWLDIALLIPLLLAAWRGFRRGLILELATLVGLGLGIFIGLRFSNFAADLLTENLDIQGEHLPILSFAITFLAVVIAVFLLGKMLEKVIKIMALSFLNKLAGLSFSVLKVALILSVIIVIFDRFNHDLEFIKNSELENSLSYRYLKSGGELVLPKFEKAIDEGEISL